MTDAHAILAKAWEDGNALALAVLADKFDEDGVPAAGDLIRLTAEDLCDPRSQPARASALRESREAVERHLRAAGWRGDENATWASDLFGDEVPTTMLVTGDGDDRRVLVACPGQAVYDLRFRRAGGEQWAATAGGAEVGRAAVPPLDRPWNPIDDFPFGGDAYTLGEVFGDRDVPAGALDATAAAIGPAAVPVHALPTELLPVAAGRLAAHLHAPDRRVRAGEVAPGAHVFEYRGGWWQYVRTLNRRETAGQDYYINIDPSRFDVLFGLVLANRPRLLVRVEADGRPRPAILTWWYGSRYDHRKRRREFLPRAYFDWAARYLGLSADRFAVHTPAKARALFRPQKG